MQNGKGVAAAALTFLFVAVVSVIAVRYVSPPEAVPASAPTGEFSSARALAYLRGFAREPHPVGSAAHDAVRQYIVAQITALGVQPEVTTTPQARDGRGGFPLNVATISDITARLPGTANTRALVLLCHYDSVAGGPGAADDGEGVAVLLETLRALRTGPPLRNDLIFLFTDGEETGLLGAKAFLEARGAEVGLAMNFESRGSHGPSLLFETSPGNGWLVRQVADATPDPQGSSLAYDAYQRLPFDTDLSLFKRAGIPSLNFAFIDGISDYHSRLDDVQHISERSLQHQGSYALPLARRFGNLDLRQVRAGDVTYFNFPGVRMVTYPLAWSMPLALAAGLLFVAVAGFGLARGRVTAGGILGGFLAFLAALIGTAIAVAALWLLVLVWHPDYRQMLLGDVFNPGAYRAACVALAVAIFALLYHGLRRRAALTGLWGGALLLWAVLAVLSARYFPGGAYLFTWPVLFGAAGWAILMARGGRMASWGTIVALWVCVTPGLLLAAPTIQELFVAMTMRLAAAPALLAALLLGLLIPLLEVMAAPRRWWLPGAAALVCAACLLAGTVRSAFDPDHPKPDSLFYGLDADTGAATWFSGDLRPDAWTIPVLGANPRREQNSPLVPYITWRFFVNSGAAASLPSPKIERLDDRTEGGERVLRLHIVSERHAPVIFVYGDPQADVLGAVVNGQPLAAGLLAPPARPGLKALDPVRSHRWSFAYDNPPREGFDLALRLREPAAPLRMLAIDQSFSLDGAPGAPVRPAGTMPLIWTPDSVFVRKAFTF